MKEEWDIYGVCKCGWCEEAPFGRLVHIHKEVCPECGTHKSEWTLKTRKWIPKHKIIIKGHWEDKESK